MSFPARLGVTIGGALLALGLSRVPIVGVDVVRFRDQVGVDPTGNMSVVGLGLIPVIAAYAVVELVALLVPPLSRARHAGPDGRATIHRVVAVVAAAFCALQGYRMDSLLRSASLTSAGMPTIVLTMTAGTFALWAVGQVVSRYGLGNGVIWLVGVGSLASALTEAPLLTSAPAPRGALSTGLLAAGIAGAVAVTVLVLWPTMRKAHSLYAKSGEEGPEKKGMAIPVPSSGIAPLMMASSLLLLPAALVSVRALEDGSFALGDVETLVAMAALTVLCAAVLGMLFHPAGRVSELLGRLRIQLDVSGAGGAGQLARRSLPGTVGYVVALSCTSMLGLGARAWGLALLTAWAMDAVAGHLVRRGRSDLVTAWTDERPFAAVAAQAALRHRGIEAALVGLCQRTLLQFGAGYAPVEVLVSEKDAPRAHAILRRALPDRAGGEASESESEAGEKKKKKKRALDVVIAPVARASVAVGAIALVMIGLVVFRDATKPPPPGPLTAAQIEERAKVLHLLWVADDADPLAEVVSATDLPKGVRFERDNAPLGRGKTAPRWYVFAPLGEGETTGALQARIQPWVDKIQVPEGTHLAFQEVTEMDPDTGTLEVTGLRTYLLKNELLLTGADVEDAMAAPGNRDRNEGWLVRVQLTPDGAERFQRATAANIRRRLAIVVRGRVLSAPVIQSEIGGGTVVITMGPGSEGEQRTMAKELAKALSSP
ncbi:MAG: DUF2007 domain-containing protein [Polyangiaceae bacterium]